MTRPPTLVSLLARSVESRPEAEAIVGVGRRVSYEQLWSLVCRFAGALRAYGLDAGDRVGLVARNSPEFVAAYYAALAAGGVVVPLNADAKAHDLAAWIRHCGARVVLVDDAHPERPALAAALDSTAAVVALGDMLTHTPLEPAVKSPGATGGTGLGSILYRSGTTGRPKGVMLSHENLVSNVLAVVEYLRLDASDRVLSALPFFHSYGNSVLHTHLAVGARVVLAPSMMFPHRVVEAMRYEGVTGFSGVPWMFSTLLARTAFANMRKDLPALRYLTQAGARMDPAVLSRVVRAFPEAQFFVMYGQAEATARLSYLPPTELSRRAGSVGRGIPGVRLQVRRPDGTRAVPREIGEVYAAGPNIMLGYWNAPELTCAAIAEEPSARWLRTGDLGYQDTEGFLYLVGRHAEMITSLPSTPPGSVRTIAAPTTPAPPLTL